MFEHFAAAARTAVTEAQNEAGRRGDRRVGTDHLLIGALSDPATAALIGLDPQGVRSAAAELDRAALAAIGLDVETLPPGGPAVAPKRIPFSPASKQVMGRMLSYATAEKARRITPKHLVLALLDGREPDPAAAVFAALGVDGAALRARLAAA